MLHAIHGYPICMDIIGDGGLQDLRGGVDVEEVLAMGV